MTRQQDQRGFGPRGRGVRAMVARVLVGVSACSLLLAGCAVDREILGLDTDNTTTESAIPTAAAPSSPISTPTGVQKLDKPKDDPYLWDDPKDPPARYEYTQEGAIATAMYFVELMGYEFSMGQTQALENVSGAECKNCKHLIEQIAQDEAIGSWTRLYTTADREFVGVMPILPEYNDPGEWGVQIIATVPPYEIYEADTGDHFTTQEHQIKFAINLEWMNDRWMVVGTYYDKV